MAEYLKTINGSLLPIGGTNVYVEQMTQAEYDALPSATKDDNHFRVVVNPDGGEPGIRASEIVSDDGNVQDDINSLQWKVISSGINLTPTAVGTAKTQTFSALAGAQEVVVNCGGGMSIYLKRNDYGTYNTATRGEQSISMQNYERTIRAQWTYSNGEISITQTVKGTSASLYPVDSIYYR